MNDQVPTDSNVPHSGVVLLVGFLRLLASLQLAVVLIGVYAAVLVVGTAVEKQSGSEAARQTVYGSGWFVALHVLLAINILAALLVRFPWRRSQVGFVVTHIGLLVLLAGCWSTRYAGVEAQLSVFEGHRNRLAREVSSSQPFALGFQVHLHKFRRRLDPGSGTPSHYSSLVDFLDCSNPPKKLQGNVQITLNAPVDFTDPQSGRTYRLFQSSFQGPLLPGDAEFDQIVGSDHSRDQVYCSVFSVNYDPGRNLKYLGSAMVIAGIALVYYFRRLRRPPAGSSVPPLDDRGRDVGDASAIEFSRAVAKGPATLCLGLVLSLLGGACPAEESPALDWSVWQHLPVLGEGRVEPLDTFAREAVTTVCGHPEPTLVVEDGKPRRFTSAELLFSWLVQPERWEKVPFLIAADEELRAMLSLPLVDADGRRLRYASPVEVENCQALGHRLAELQERANAEGKNFRLAGVDKQIKELFDAYAKFRLLTYDPRSSNDPPQRFFLRLRLAGSAWRKLASNLQAAQRISKDDEIRQAMVDAGDALQKLMGQIHGEEVSLSKTGPVLARFCQAADKLASRLSKSDDRPLVGLAADLQRQTAEMHLALYDNGDQLRLVPALNAGALEENRTPGDDASPWLGFPALIFGSPELMSDYPSSQLQQVRKAFDEAKAIYLDRDQSDRSQKFSAAMQQLAESLRSLGEAIGPLREKLVIQHRDQSLLEVTAYPLAGATKAEVFYSRLNPFFWSWVVSLAATLCLVLAVARWRRLFWLGIVAIFVAQGFTAAGMSLRGYITGLVPLTGMFETVVFVAMYSSLLGVYYTLSPLWALRGRTLAERLKHVAERRLFAMAGAIVGFVAGALAYYAPASVMHRNIGSVTPILRDNFWLAVHVVTIMASYASAAIALILGNIALGYYLFGRYRGDDIQRRLPPEKCATLARFIYAPLKITVLLLATGTILGAFWADKAWGRFWAWDPKEVWALISLLVYLLMLHTRHIRWTGDFGMSVTAVFGFTAILITWYAVNFVLGSGMHAYGSGAGGQTAVGGAVLLQWLFLLGAGVRYWSETRGGTLSRGQGQRFIDRY